MRRAIVGMLTWFLLFSMLNMMFNTAFVAASPGVLRVGKGPLYDYQTIRAAIGNASEGDTIIVSEGTYAEGQINVNISSLTLLADGKVIVDGLQKGHVFYVTADNVTINGFTIKNSSPEADYIGVYLRGVQNCNISNNIVTNNYYGIALLGSSYNIISENNVTNNLWYGIMLYDGRPALPGPSPHNNLIGNIVANNAEGGILLEFTGGDNTLRNNNISGSRYNFGVYGGLIQDYINDVDVSNTVNGKPIYYLVNKKSLTINSSTHDVGYLGIVNCTDITVKGLELKNNFNGVLLAFTNNSRIIGNHIIYNEFNIYMLGSNNITIINNSIINSPLAGIYVRENSTSNTIYHNDFVDNMELFQACDVGANNTWDDGYPSGGNYWSDYNGTDEDGDGIGDIPYNITGAAGSQDRYPLMNPLFTLIGDVNGDGVVDIFDIVIVAAAYGSRPGDPNWNSDADQKPDGLIDIFDLVKVAGHFGEKRSSSSTSSSSSSTNSPVISVYPDEIIVYEHETFSVNVTVTNVTDLYGWEFKLYWNNTVLNCTGAEIHAPGVWGGDVFEVGPGIENNFNATHGRYWKAMSALHPAPSFDGSMVVVTLTFEAMTTGSLVLDLQETKLADREAYAISHTAVDGFVTVPLVVFSDDFEDGDVSDWTSGDTHEIVADTSRKYGGSYSGRFRRTWYRGTPRSWKAFTTPIASGNITVVWWAQNDYTTHSHFFSVSDGTGLKGFVLCFRYNGYIQWYGNGTYHNIQPYSADTWYKFELRINLDQRKYSIRINDMLKVAQADANGAPSQADHFVLVSADRGYYAWIDNITIYAMN